jgi:hypothetical protein
MVWGVGQGVGGTTKKGEECKEGDHRHQCVKAMGDQQGKQQLQLHSHELGKSGCTCQRPS